MATQTQIKTNINPFPVQWQVLDSTKRFILANSGIQGGKTVVGGMWLFKQIVEKGFDCNYLMAAPTYKILKQSTLPKFFEIIGWNTLSEIGTYHKQDSEFIFKYGKGKIFIRSCEEPDLLEGMTIDGAAWLDEAGQLSSRVWINIQGRTSMAQAPVLMTTTPYMLNWIYKEVYKQWQKKNPDYDVFTWRSIDNPYFPKAEYERCKATMNQDDFARRYNAEWRQISGLVYPDFDVSKHVVESMELAKGWQYFCGVDFGFTNPTAVVWVCKDNDANYYIFDEYYQRGMTASEHVEIVREKSKAYFIKGYYCDPTAREEIQDFINAGMRNIFGGRTDKAQGIRKVTEFLKAGKLKVFANCLNLIDEFQSYHIAPPKENKNLMEEPMKVDDHALDALRYCIINTSWSDHPLAPKKEQIEIDGEMITRPKLMPKDTIDRFVRKQNFSKEPDQSLVENLYLEHK